MGQLFDLLKQALGSVLAFFYDVLVPPLTEGNGLGISIILLTIFINLVLFPLTLKQTRATRAFQEIQPEIKRLQKEYKDDPQEMQKRLMELQKSAGATPGGCLLPMLIQMPIWFALFQLLRAPLILDANLALIDGAAHPINPASALGIALLDHTDKLFLGMNLSVSPNQAFGSSLLNALPYLVLMAVMVATQYVQQWHATYGQVRPVDQKGAGAQQAITKIMPLFIGFISWNFPAGLILYWTTSNLFRFGQQVLIFKMDGRPTPAGTNTDPTPDPGSIEGEPKQPQPGANDKRRRRRRK
ncbi:MAG TPA: YidC/Oxa1 family membrane protein insertase [Acidimicrobiia bacterium]|nr:YidC/Oxa1 family membrane protein insertase [Acidimicrobiia bacterium]